MAKSRKHVRHVRRGVNGTSQRKYATKQLAEIKPRQEIKDIRRAGWNKRAAVVVIAALLATVAGLAVDRTRLHSQLDSSDVEKGAAEVAATDARNARFSAEQERDKALQDVKRLEQQTKELTSQIASNQATIDTQRDIIDNPQKILDARNAKLLEPTRNGTKIDQGEEVKEGKRAAVKGELVMPDQGPARFVAIDARRADNRIATAISDKNGRFSMEIPRGDEVVLTFLAPGRMTSDITLSGKHQYQLKVLLVERKGVQLQK